MLYMILETRGSSDSIMTRLRVCWPELDPRKVQGCFLFATASRPALRPT